MVNYESQKPPLRRQSQERNKRGAPLCALVPGEEKVKTSIGYGTHKQQCRSVAKD